MGITMHDGLRKNFAAYGAAVGGRDYNSVDMSCACYGKPTSSIAGADVGEVSINMRKLMSTEL